MVKAAEVPDKRENAVIVGVQQQLTFILDTSGISPGVNNNVLYSH